jgi:hypothetical protein
MATLRIGPSALHSLARKYRLLAELARAGSASRRRADASYELTLLGREFPGALVELERLGLAEIDARLAAVERALSSGRAESWIAWMNTYHETMRAALVVRRRTPRVAVLSRDRAEQLARSVNRDFGAHCDASFVLAVAARPPGRLGQWVMERVGGEMGVSPATLRRALFMS